MLTQTTVESPLLNLTGTVHWRDRWWLLDVETSGLDRQEDDIIALRLAWMENYNVIQEREILVRPRRPLRPWVEGLTGISNQTLEQALPLEEALRELDALDSPLLFLDRDFTLSFLRIACSRCGREFSKLCLLLDRLTAMLLGGSPRQKTERFLEKLPLPDCFRGVPPRNTDLRKLYELSLAVFYALENVHHIQDTAQLNDWNFYGIILSSLREGTKMLIKNMEYLSQRLRCTDEEKDACLETVTAILHFWTDTRKNGLLAIGGDRAEQDPNLFFRVCLLDAIEWVGSEDEPLLEELFAQYLIAGDYTGGLFLQNMVIAEGILAYLKFLQEHEDGGSFQQWGDRLPAVVGGYFGVEHREKVRKTIRREIRKWERDVKKTSFLPEFDALGSLPLPLCEKLLRDTYDNHYAFGDRALALALKYASGAVQDHVLSVLSPEERNAMEEEMDACTLVRQTDVEHAQREILERAASYESSER